ncbi:MAG: hypothetical protein ACJAYU_004451 [Bradymonadia bacterium]|jgi:hypothetical protein
MITEFEAGATILGVGGDRSAFYGLCAAGLYCLTTGGDGGKVRSVICDPTGVSDAEFASCDDEADFCTVVFYGELGACVEQ